MSFPEIPKSLRLSPEVRRAAWLAQPPRPMPIFTAQPKTMEADAVQLVADIAEEKRRASLNRIGKMKAKQSQGKVSAETHRWNAGRGCFEPLAPPEWKLQRGRDEHARFMEMHPDAKPLEEKSVYMKLVATYTRVRVNFPKNANADFAVTKDNAERIAKLNGVWKDNYGALQAGLMTMSVKNRLKRLVKEGHSIVWE